MTVADMVLDSWDRQCRIVDAVASRVDETNRSARPSPDGMTLDHQLAHIHKVRHHFLGNVAPDRAAMVGDSFEGGLETPIGDLDRIRQLLRDSGAAVREVVEEALANETGAFGWYDHPMLFLQHLVWHEGWHIGLIFLGLRLAGHEPPEEWEEERVWGEWRTETW